MCVYIYIFLSYFYWVLLKGSKCSELVYFLKKIHVFCDLFLPFPTIASSSGDYMCISDELPGDSVANIKPVVYAWSEP